mgnify:CR=1 FL=1
MKAVIGRKSWGGVLGLSSAAVVDSVVRWSSKVAENEGMSEPELEKKIQKKKTNSSNEAFTSNQAFATTFYI